MLTAELEEQADWRRQKAVEYPLDRRNRDAAACCDAAMSLVGQERRRRFDGG
jgi:hypothetical protein